MTDRAHIPKVVASEMGAVQTRAVKSLDIFLREGEEVMKDASRCGKGVVSELRFTSGDVRCAVTYLAE